jgi:REP element-mobilizing transposase RayT
LDGDRRPIVVSAFAYAIEQERIYLRAFVVMPDHWHALFALRDPWTLPKFMHALMSHVAAQTTTHLRTRGVIWQDTYYDTRVRTARQFRYIAYYIEQNPVKRSWFRDQRTGMPAARPEGIW